MENLIETIRTATSSAATDAERAAGAIACRSLLAALEARAGEPLVAPASPGDPRAIVAQPPVSTPPQAEAIRAIASALRGMQPDQLLDLAITRLRAAMPEGVDIAPARGVTFNLLPVPSIGERS